MLAGTMAHFLKSKALFSCNFIFPEFVIKSIAFTIPFGCIVSDLGL